MLGPKYNKVKRCSDSITSFTGLIGFGEEEFSSTSTESEPFHIPSQGTLNVEFFDSLWPLILKENVCELKSKHKAVFQPVQTFDAIWAHSLLAKKGFKDYEEPTELRCFKEKKLDKKVPKRREDVPKIVCKPKVETISEQVAAYQQDTWVGQYHSYRFVTRLRPWYMKQTFYDEDFKITDEMVAPIKSPFDLRIVEAIKENNIKLLIIDMGTDVSLSEMEHWLPFCKFIKMLVIVHDRKNARRLRILKDIFEVLDFEEDWEATWQSDLERALNMAFAHAVEKLYVQNLGSLFVFAFSRARGLCTIDTFEVIYKDLESLKDYFDYRPPKPEKDPCGNDIVEAPPLCEENCEEEEEEGPKAKCYDISSTKSTD